LKAGTEKEFLSSHESFLLYCTMSLPVPVALYIPNLLGYTRIILAFVGLFLSQSHLTTTVIVWMIAAALDFLDGILARWLNQTSNYGILIDVAADNILRTVAWITCIITSTSSTQSSSTVVMLVAFISTIVTCLEWCTMLATQLNSKINDGLHWKEQCEVEEEQTDPTVVQAFFRNNFRK